MNSPSHPSIAALLALVVVQCISHVNAGYCDVGQSCGVGMDCREGQFCSRLQGMPEATANCHCRSDPVDQNEKLEIERTRVVCHNYQLSPAHCIYRGSCGQGAQCGLTRDCASPLVCVVNPRANPNDPYKGMCAQWTPAVPQQFLHGNSANMKCHYGNGLSGFWANLRGY